MSLSFDELYRLITEITGVPANQDNIEMRWTRSIDQLFVVQTCPDRDRRFIVKDDDTVEEHLDPVPNEILMAPKYRNAINDALEGQTFYIPEG